MVRALHGSSTLSQPGQQHTSCSTQASTWLNPPSLLCALLQVEVRIQTATRPGQDVVLAGSHPALGSWSLDGAARLSWTDGHIWCASLDVPADCKFEYKVRTCAVRSKCEVLPGMLLICARQPSEARQCLSHHVRASMQTADPTVLPLSCAAGGDAVCGRLPVGGRGQPPRMCKRQHHPETAAQIQALTRAIGCFGCCTRHECAAAWTALRAGVTLQHLDRRWQDDRRLLDLRPHWHRLPYL